MLKYLAILVILIVVQVKIVAQSKRIDSLRKKIESARGTQRVDLLNELSSEVSSYNYDQANQVALAAYGLAEKLNYSNGKANALLNTGLVELTIGKDTLARQKLRQCIALCEQSKDDKLKATALTYVAQSHQNSDQLDSAELYIDKAYQILKGTNSPVELSFLYRIMAKLQELKNNPKLQLDYLKKSWAIREKMNDKRFLIYVGRDLAVYYTEQSNYSKSDSILNLLQASLGEDTVNNEEISVIYKERAIIYADRGNYRAALSLFAKVKKFYEQNESQLELVNLYTDMGHVLSYSSSNYETSLKYFFKAIRIAEARHFLREATLLYARVAWVYYLMEQDRLAEDFGNKALQSATNKYAYEEASALNLLGMVSTRKKENEKALDYFTRALAIREKNNFQAATASTLLNMGALFEQMGNYKKAEEYDLKSLKLDEALNNAVDLSYSYQALGQLYTKTRNFDKALYFLNKAEVLTKKIKALDILRDVYQNKRDLLHLQSNYPDALRYSLLYENLHDSLFNKTLSDRIAAMQYDFELDQKDNQIKFLNQQRQLQQNQLARQQAEIRLQRLAIIVGIVFFIGVCVVAYVIFFYYKKVKKLNIEVAERNEEITVQSEELRESNEMLGKLNREISEQKEEIQAQAEELVESNQAIARINEGLEEKIKERTFELKEAYRELDTFFYRSSHDFRRPLTTFMGLAEVAKVMVKDAAALELFSKVNETAHNLDKMLMKLQSISLVGSDELTKTEINFETIFQTEVHHFQSELLRKKIQIDLKVEVKNIFYSYPVLLKTIVQNLLENAISFCGDQQPTIHLSAATIGEEVQLEISDNGQGIDNSFLPRVCEMYFRANEKSTGNGLGLYIVKKIVDKLQGRMNVTSELGKGTTVIVVLPNRLNYIFK